jgi:hypothetical protein
MMDDDLKMPRPPSRPLLPPVSTYLRAVFALGRASIAPGFPALAFFYFYRLGMGLYLALSVDRVVSIDDMSAGGLMAPTVLQIPAYIRYSCSSTCRSCSSGQDPATSTS